MGLESKRRKRDRAMGSVDNLPIQEFLKHRERINGDVVSYTTSSDPSLAASNDGTEAWSELEEGEIIEGPDSPAELRRHHGVRFSFFSSTEDNVADHKVAIRESFEVDSTCMICGQNFPSMKALYGHMRCHEGNWKGVIPPLEENFSLQATDDQVLPPLNWSVTEKRGRKAKGAATNPLYEDLEDAVINAAHNLMLLSNGRDSASYDSRIMNEDRNINSRSDSMDVDDAPSVDAYKTEGLTGYKTVDTSIQLAINVNGGGDASSCQLAISNDSKKMDDSEKVINLASVTDERQYLSLRGTVQRQYQCSICSKSFSSPQALGGHAASHSKSKSSPGVGPLEGTKQANPAQAEGSIGRDCRPMKASEHRCNICGLAFPTGQALGGHKRKHWQGPGGNPAAPSSQSFRKASLPRLDIDLNETPPEE